MNIQINTHTVVNMQTHKWPSETQTHTNISLEMHTSLRALRQTHRHTHTSSERPGC